MATWRSEHRNSQTQLAEPGWLVEARLRTRQQLRTLWRRARAGDEPLAVEVLLLADRLALPPDWLGEELARPHPFGTLHELVLRRWRQEHGLPNHWLFVEITEAIQDLRLRLEALRRAEPVQISSRVRVQVASHLTVPGAVSPLQPAFPTEDPMDAIAAE